MTKRTALAEVRRSDRWETIDTKEARAERNAIFRCASCHGQVFFYRSYAPGSISKFGHKRAFEGCRLGQASSVLHPEALA